MADTLDRVGFRLYRRTDRELISPARPATDAGQYRESFPACGFYPRAALLNAYHARGEMRDGLPYVGDLDPELLSMDGPAYLRDDYFASGSIPAFGEMAYICGDFSRTVYRPAVEAVEAVFSEIPSAAGWNAAAISAESFFMQGRVKFRVQPGKRFLIGLSTGTDPTSLRNKFIGWRIEDGAHHELWRLGGDAEGSLTSGGNENGFNSLTSYVPYDESSVFGIELSNGRMTFTRPTSNGDTFWHPIPIPLDAPDVWSLSAIIWEPGTWVEGVEVYGFSGGATSLPGMAGRAGQGTPQSGSLALLPLMTGEAREATRGTTELPKMRALGGRAIGQAETELPGMRALGHQELEVLGLLPRSNRALPRLLASGYSTVGTVGNAFVDLPLMKARGTEGNIADAAVSLPALESFGFALPAGEARMYAFGRADDGITAFTEMLVAFDSAGNVTDAFAVGILVDGLMDSAATALDTYTLSAILEALMNSRALTGTELPHDGGTGEVWAVSLSDVAASSTFENYAFNSFGVLGGQAFGAKDDGVYRLDGDTDDGAPIRASVSFGKQDFGTKTEKQMARAYIGASSVGTMFLKIIANGNEYVYAARSSSGELQQQRFDVGRGIKANYFTFELFNKDGGEFELDSVSFFAADFKRRI